MQLLSDFTNVIKHDEWRDASRSYKKTSRSYKKTFLAIIKNLWLIVVLAAAGCSNPFYDLPGLFDPDEIVGITVVPPAKRLYRRGESLDLTGGAVHIYYRGPGVEPKLEPNISPAQVSGFDSKKGGIQTITVTIGNQSDRFDVALIPLPIGEYKPLNVSPAGTIAIPLDEYSTGSWSIYIFDLQGALAEDGEARGSESDPVSFQAPSAPSVYTVALVVKKDKYSEYNFYRLTVE